jgi:hypothetical protein
LTDQNADPSRLSDYEFTMLLIERDTCDFKARQINELLNRLGEKELTQGTLNLSEKKASGKLPESTGLTELPWKSYKTKQNATQDEAAWIFSKTPGAEALMATLRNSGGKAKVGAFEYQLQGKDQQFIARKPAQ